MLTLNPKTVNPQLDATTRAAYLQVIFNHQDVIASSLADLVEPARVEPCVIRTIGSPVYLPPIRLSDVHLQFMRKEVGEMVAHGLVTVGNGPWAAPAFAVPKPRSTKLRLVVNYKGTNSQTVRDSTPLPRVDDIVRIVGKHKKFFKLDLKSGFWQVPMHPDSVPVTGFCTPDGLYQWQRMPMGIRNGPPHFQQCMNKVLLESGMQTEAGIFIDDLGGGGKTHFHAASNLDKLMSTLEDKHVLVGVDKLGLGEDSLAFLGYLLVEGELHCDPAKTACIQKLVPPETRSHLRAFLGLTGYYRHFIKGFAAVARPLYALLKESATWSWGTEEQ